MSDDNLILLNNDLAQLNNIDNLTNIFMAKWSTLGFRKDMI